MRWLRSLWAPASLAGRFALASACMAAAAVLMVSLLSWWLIERQQSLAQERLAARERQFHAANVGSSLRAVASRMNEIANSTILATGLVDSVGKETYLAPFLNGVRQINGVPVQVLFSDFEGQEIAANSGARFSNAQREWLHRQLATGVPAAHLFESPAGAELVAMEPLRYSRTSTPEGAVLYKLALADIRLDPGLKLEWGISPDGTSVDAVPVDAPPVFKPLGLRLSGSTAATRTRANASAVPQFLAMGLIAAIAFAVLYLAGNRLGRVLMRDLLRLEAFSSKVVSAGTSERRAHEGGSAEVASLAHSINQMLERLYQQHDALKLEGEKLASLAGALQLADRRKDEFLAMLAHELRNPLAPISTGAELLRALPGADERVRRTSEIIARQVRHMTKIVDDLLDVSRVTRGLVTLEQVPVDMATVISAAYDQVRPGMEARRHRLELRVSSEPMVVIGDSARLVQVMSNLLHNAAKYTPEGGHVVLSAQALGGEVVLEVADNGSGIAPEFMPEIFGLFTQGSRLPDRSQGGLGLGLPLVKNLVGLHGGTVTAHSEGPGKGSSFVVRLPRSQAMPIVEPAPLDALPASNGLSLLLVDDNVDAAQTLATLLEMEGHRITLAYDGPSALKMATAMAEGDCFDACILDIGLPGMDGVELAGHLRQRPAAAHATLIALSGYGQEADRVRTAAAGFNHHLVKPADLAVLGQLLAALQPASRAG